MLSYGRSLPPACLVIGKGLEAVLRQLPKTGPLFPRITLMDDRSRACFFGSSASGRKLKASHCTTTATLGLNARRWWASRSRDVRRGLVAGFQVKERAVGVNELLLRRSFSALRPSAIAAAKSRDENTPCPARVAPQNRPPRPRALVSTSQWRRHNRPGDVKQRIVTLFRQSHVRRHAQPPGRRKASKGRSDIGRNGYK